MIEKGQELLVPMARFALRDDVPVEDVERRKERGGAVAVVIVGYPFDITQSHRQDRLGALQRLDLGFFIHAQDQRLVRRIEVQPDHIADFLHEEGVGGKLETLATMRLQPNSAK